MVCTDEFAILAQSEARALGAPGLPLLIIPHPLGSLAPETVQQRARAIVEAASGAFTQATDAVVSDYSSRTFEPKGRLHHKPIFD